MSYKITSSGQVSIPAGVRRRWQTSRVDVEDHGDYVVVRPVPEDPVAAVRGIFKGRMKMTTDELRRQVREEERLAMERKEAQYGR
jgi:bifunctional DNA-binding transcriptional regulator/antitoxin component of YhaV-PrlF toxin-antitoxin module